MTNSDDVKEKFYQDLKSTIAAEPSTDTLIIPIISQQGLPQRVHHEKEYWGQKALAAATAITLCYWKSVMNMGFSSLIHLLSTSLKQDIIDASLLKALALTGLCYFEAKRQA